jgi:hypothetical protein
MTANKDETGGEYNGKNIAITVAGVPVPFEQRKIIITDI